MRAAGLVARLTLLSRITGLARDIVVAGLFGASFAADAFFVAFRIPNLFRRFVAEGSASTSFVPVFMTFRVGEGPRAAARAATAVGGVAFATLSGLVIIGSALAEPIVQAIAPGFQGELEKYDLTVALTAAAFPYLLFVGMSAWAMGTLHTFQRFTAPAFGPVLFNLAMIAVAVAFVPWLSEPAYALVGGVLLGGALQFVAQIPSLRACGVSFAGFVAPKHPAVSRVGRLLLPALVGGAVYQINILVATVLATLLPAGSISWLWYADRIFEFPVGIVAAAVGTAALPVFSGQASAGNFDQMARSVSVAMRLVWSLCIPATIGLWLLAPSVVAVLLQRGQFSPTDSVLTAAALRAYVVGLVGVASGRVLASVFYALERPRLPLVVAGLSFLVNLVCGLALMGPPDPAVQWWGGVSIGRFGEMMRVADLNHAGLALGTSIAATFNAACLGVLVWWRLPRISLRRSLRAASVHGFAASVMGGVIHAWQQMVPVFFSPSRVATAEVVGGVMLGVVVYFTTMTVLGGADAKRIVAVLTGNP